MEGEPQEDFTRGWGCDITRHVFLQKDNCDNDVKDRLDEENTGSKQTKRLAGNIGRRGDGLISALLGRDEEK